ARALVVTRARPMVGSAATSGGRVIRGLSAAAGFPYRDRRATRGVAPTGFDCVGQAGDAGRRPYGIRLRGTGRRRGASPLRDSVAWDRPATRGVAPTGFDRVGQPADVGRRPTA